ncbi:MAG: enoyl-CoA hydratase-related protein [Cumulibacter sp.]
MTELATPHSATSDSPAFEHIRLERSGQVYTLTMARAKRRNSLSEEHMREILQAMNHVATTDARILVIAADGPVFSSGHDFADMIDRDLVSMRELLQLCTEMMTRMHSLPQVVIAKVQGLATAAGCQMVASADLAVAAQSAGFALPGAKGGWFCHTPSVGVSRTIGRKRLMELALTGEPVDANTAEAWGLINYAVPDDELDAKVADLADRLCQGSAANKAVGKQTIYNHLDRPESEAYLLAIEVMAGASQTDHAREGMSSFVEKRAPIWPR